MNLGPKNGLVNVHIQRDSNHTEIYGVCTSNVGHKSGIIQDMKGKQSIIQVAEPEMFTEQRSSMLKCI